jgi:hypothetical protein
MTVTERDFDPDALGLPSEPEDDPEEGVLPGVDLNLGQDEDIAGGDNLAGHDEQNMYGNDALVDDYADLEEGRKK